MGQSTAIQWCDHTFNPWRGCAKIASGCVNCYAERQAKRNSHIFGSWGPKGYRTIASESYWRQPHAWNRAAEKAGASKVCAGWIGWPLAKQLFYFGAAALKSKEPFSLTVIE